MAHTKADLSALLDAFSQACFEECDGTQMDFSAFRAAAARTTTAAFSLDDRQGLRAGARVLVAADGGLPLLSKVVGLWHCGAIPLVAPAGADAASAALTEAVDWRWDGDRPIPLRQPTALRLPCEGHDTTAVIHVTSGSTSTPKLAPRSVTSFLAEARRYRARYGFVSEERALLAAPIGHSFGFGALLGLAASGAIIRVPPVFSPGRSARSLIAGDYAVIILTAQMARLLVAAARRIRAKPAATLRLAIAGAGPVSEALSNDFASIFDCPLGRNYGCSETGATFGDPTSLPEGVIGRAFDGVRILSPSSQGTAELILDLGHVVLANKQPPLSIWRSGDDARRLPDGAVHLLGRRDARLKVNGQSVDSAPLIATARAVPGVSDAIALVLQAPSAPDRDYLALVCEGEAITCENLAEAFGRRDAARPHRIAIIRRFPRTTAGKPDRVRIAAEIAAGGTRLVVFDPRSGESARDSQSAAEADILDAPS